MFYYLCKRKGEQELLKKNILFFYFFLSFLTKVYQRPLKKSKNS